MNVLWQLSSTQVIAVATVTYVVVTTFMLWQMRRTAEHTKESVEVAGQAAEMAHRPFVGCVGVDAAIKDIESADGRSKGKALYTTVKIRNVGAAPAREIDATYVPRLGAEEMEKEGQRHSDLLLFPGTEHYFWGVVAPTLNGEPVDDLEVPFAERTLTVRVLIRYTGVDGNVYRTRQEYVYKPKIQEYAHVGGEAT